MSFYDEYKPFRNYMRRFELLPSLVDVWRYSLRALHRAGPQLRHLHLEILAIVGDGAAAPQAADDIDRLLYARAAVVAAQPMPDKFVLVVNRALAHADIDPAPAQIVEQRKLDGHLSSDQRKPVAPALMILFQVERHDSELHRPCSAAPHDPAMLRTIPLPRRRVYRMWGAAFLLLGLYLVPVLVSFCLPDPRGGVPWRQAPRDPTGLSPDPAVTQEAVIQVFAAPAVALRGLFSVHTWIAVKPTGAPRFTRYEVLGSRAYSSPL
jgi:hypothetical protein